MKKIFTLAIAMLVASASFAQLAVGVGYINPKQTIKYGDNDPKITTLNGFQAGIDYSLNFGEVALTPGVHFTYATASDQGTILSGLASASGNTTEMYAAIPVHLSYGYDLARDLRLFVFAGPTFNYGLSSKTKVEGSVLGLSGETTYDNFEDGKNYGKFEVLLGGGVGFDLMDTFRFSLGYDYGLTNRYTGDLEKYKQHTGMVNFSIAYLL